MLFNSPVFLFAFLPLAVVLFHLLRRRATTRLALGWLTAASLVFYAWWEPVYLILLLASVAMNYQLGRGIAARPAESRPLLWLGIAFNLALLGWFKYAGFLDRALEGLAGLDLGWSAQVLPLAISFFTFQQIAYLVDLTRGAPAAESFPRFLLFITFFPHLIAGPIVHPAVVLPQFADLAASRHAADGRWQERFALGLFLFAVGLFKKVVVADGIADWANGPFDAVAAGAVLGAATAWIGALAYTLQLYFDFSGYSDMALGLALWFGIRLPVNFLSPYQATSIVEFWRRWHMTLSRFLRDYLYIPLGGSRKGPARRYVNLLLTMLLGGLWHGAGWTFALWGLYHGLLLALTHLLTGRRGERPAPPRLLAVPLTFLLVLLGWVLFRAADLPTAWGYYGALLGLGEATTAGPLAGEVAEAAPVLLLLLLAVFLLPNPYRLVGWSSAAPTGSPAPGRLRFRPDWRWALLTAALLLAALGHLTRASQFLYFDF